MILKYVELQTITQESFYQTQEKSFQITLTPAILRQVHHDLHGSSN